MFFLYARSSPLMNVPALLLALATIDPLSYGGGGLRALLIGVSHFGVATDVAVLLAIAVLPVHPDRGLTPCGAGQRRGPRAATA